MGKEITEKYKAEINLIKNIVGLLMFVGIFIANLVYEKKIDYMLMLIPTGLLGLDISKFFNK